MANHLNLDLSGGMNVSKAPLTLSDNECELALNYNLSRYGALTKRKGYTKLGSQLVDNNSILGLYAYSGMDTLIAVINASGGATSTLYRFNGSSWESKRTGLTASKRAYFAEFVDRLFMVNGADDMQSSGNGTSLGTWAYTSCPPSTDAFRPKYISVYEDRVYAACLEQGSGTSSRLHWSSLPSGGAISWDVTNDWADIDPDDQYPITGLTRNGNRLLVFKQDALYRWQFGAVEADRIIGVGAFSQDCIVTNYEIGITFFFSPHGVYAYSLGEGRPKLISRPIKRILEQQGNSTWDNCVMACDSEHLYISGISSVTIDGRTISNPWLVYNIALDAWTLYSTFDLPTAMGIYYNQTKDIGLVFGSSDGELFSFSTSGGASSSNNYPTDNGNAIETDFISKEYLLNIPKQARVEEIDIISLVRNRTQVFFDADRQNEWAPSGELHTRISKVETKQPRCNTVRIRATSNNAGEQIIEGYNIQYEPLAYEDQKAYGRKAEQHR